MLRKKKVKRPFMFGRIMHEMAEAYLKGSDPFKILDLIELDNKKLFKREIEMYGNIIEDMRDIMTEYFLYWTEQGDYKPIKGPDGQLAEHEFRIELEKGLWFTGKIDAIVKSRKLKWLNEHKTFNRQPSEDDRWRSVQAAVYFKALYEVGFGEIDGILWDYVWSKPPSVPTVLLQSGAWSSAKINTLPTRLKRWIKEEGLKKKDFTKLLGEANENRRSYFQRIYSPVKPKLVEHIWEDFLETAKEIADFHGQKKAMTIGRHCSWCDYQGLCKAEMTGADVQFVLNRDYTTEPEKRTGDEDRSDD